MKSDNPFEITQQNLIRVLGITSAALHQNWTLKPVRKEGRYSFYNLIDAVKELKDKVKKTHTIGGDLSAERARLTRAKARKAEAEADVIEQNLLKYDDVFLEISEMIRTFRGRLLNIPTKISGVLSIETDIKKIQEIIKNNIYEALEECAKYTVENKGKKSGKKPKKNNPA